MDFKLHDDIQSAYDLHRILLEDEWANKSRDMETELLSSVVNSIETLFHPVRRATTELWEKKAPREA